ncbi:MAG: hypothetical protein CMJ84_05185 [Planctomycetes bacterium]|jgi:hypothetical protein|nr:hypothetical protein [Planctomycetota bacterium]MDP6408127.1 hypothetical protein [Planctomycetota bacterium]
MKAPLGILATALVLAALATGSAFASAAPCTQDGGDPRATARERWERLSEEEKASMRERFERFQKMDAQQRRELEGRHRKLERTRKRVKDDLSPQQRERLGKLTDSAHRELVGELVEEELRAEGRRLRTKLPDSVRERFERASPEQRQRFFVEFKEKTLPRMSLRAVTELARALGLNPEEERRIKALPPRERVEKVFELRKRLEAEAVERGGLPAGITRSRWEELASLPPQEFYRVAMQRDHRAHDGHPLAPEDLQALPEAERRRRAADRILHAMRVTPDERLELADLSPPQRRKEVERRRRRRVMEIVSVHGIYGVEQLERIEAMNDGEFFASTRRLLHEAGPPRRGPHPPPRDPGRGGPHDTPRPGQRPPAPHDRRPPDRDRPPPGDRGQAPPRPRQLPRELDRAKGPPRAHPAKRARTHPAGRPAEGDEDHAVDRAKGRPADRRPGSDDRPQRAGAAWDAHAPNGA